MGVLQVILPVSFYLVSNDINGIIILINRDIHDYYRLECRIARMRTDDLSI